MSAKKKHQVVLRLLARRHGASWEVLPVGPALKAALNRAAWPEWADQKIEVAEAVVRTDMEPPRLVSVTTSIWKFDAAGIIDDQFAMAEMLRKLDEPPTEWSNGVAPGVDRHDLIEICEALGVASTP